MSTSASANNSFAASVLAQFETDFQKYVSAYADWAAFASQMETNNGQSKVTARLEYSLNNECSGIWAELYGNTTDTQFTPSKNQELDQRTRFCARLNTMYWQQRKDEYLDKHPTVNPAADEYNEMEAATDMELLNIIVSLEEAQLNHARLLAKFSMAKNHYEAVTGAEFVYKPYAVTQRNSTSVAANAKLGAALLKRATA